MARVILTALLLTAISIPPAAAQNAGVPLAGRWALDRGRSEFPKEIGFNLDSAIATDEAEGGGSGGRGRRSSGGGSAAPFSGRPESEEEATRSRLLVAEVRNPPTWLSIAATSSAVTVTDERGNARTFHPDGKEESLKLGGDVSVTTTAQLVEGNLVVTYQIEPGRQLRYTYAAAGDPRQLIVDVQFVERGGGDSVRRTYDATTADAPAPAPTARPGQMPAGSAPASPGTPGAGGVPPGGMVPAAGGNAPKADLRPGAELKGLNRLGVVVEDLGSQAKACGLTQEALETAVTKKLTDAGFSVARNTDEDTYLYVNVASASLGGTCVSRYDTTLYTHTTATLPYTSEPVLVQVELLHQGGMAGGAPATNAQSVTKGVTGYVDQFITQVRNANKQGGGS